MVAIVSLLAWLRLFKMRIKITKAKHHWHHQFLNQEFEVCEGYDRTHPQYPVMTYYGRTWFDVDAVTVMENNNEGK